jgi:hypothetical protein
LTSTWNFMDNGNSQSQSKQADFDRPPSPDVTAARARAVGRRPNLIVTAVPILLVLITFLFWYQTWWGRRMSDADMGKYLADTSSPHETQHALSQLAERVARGDAAARQWYPQVVALSRNKEAGLRVMAAWVMGQDNKSEEFHTALQRLLDDPDPMVRGNAALGMVRFGDASGRAELRAMLQPYPLTAPQAGKVSFRLKEQDTVGAGSIVARIELDDSQRIDVRSSLSGRVERRLVKDESAVSEGEQIAILSPGEDQVWECLRALYLVGTEEDLPDVERYARGVPNLPDRIRQQAALTAQAIRQRMRE